MKTKLKVSRIGWIPRDSDIQNVIIPNPSGLHLSLRMVYVDMRSKEYWADCSWPPRKVRVTVEEI